jgi:uncharacterized protein YdeI (YjbR/CyaY-like superfamily)
MNKTNPKVDAYIERAKQWRQESEKLREIILDCGLTEDLKWGKPCYAVENGNVVIIQGFKEYCALLFFKGVLLNDPNGILVKVGENTRVGRQIRFTDMREILEMESILKAYIHHAIEVEKAGLKVELGEEDEQSIPEELESKFHEVPELKTAFDALTPGRQRAYILHFSAPKQSKTRESRIENCVPRILGGKGLND